jgi:hypothetical protein
MELDDLKNTWDNINQSEKQPHLTPKIIDQMIQKKYNSKINKIAYPEITGIMICLIGTVFIGVNFYKLDTSFLQTAGIVSILLLVMVSVISLISLRKLNITEDVNQPYAETLKKFASQKLQFYKLQKINSTLSYLLAVTIIILLSKLFNGRDIAESKYFWLFSFTFGYIFLLFYSKLVSKSYKKTVNQAEELLKELQS